MTDCTCGLGAASEIHEPDCALNDERTMCDRCHDARMEVCTGRSITWGHHHLCLRCEWEYARECKLLIAQGDILEAVRWWKDFCQTRDYDPTATEWKPKPPGQEPVPDIV